MQVLKLYWPPDPDWRSHAFRFHLAQSVSIIAMWAAAWVFGLWIVGRLPFMPQVAWASDVAAITRKVDAVHQENGHISATLRNIQLLQLHNNISQQLKDLCLAKRSKNQVDLDSANGQLTQLLDEYYDMAGRPFALPSCATVLVDAN